MPKLTIHNRKTGEQKKIDLSKDSLSIGRHSSNDIALDSKTVSRKHAEIVEIDGSCFIVDANSGNGTFLNNRKLKPQEKNLLQSDDIIRIEEFEIIPSFPEKKINPEEENTDSGIIEIKMIKKVLSALDQEQTPYLEVLSEPSKGLKVYLSSEIEELIIGRDKECQLSIDTDVISRRHAIVQKKWGGITLTDLKSKNGTFIQNKRISEHILKDGDIITFGNIQVRFINPEEVDLESISKEYEERASQLDKQKADELQDHLIQKNQASAEAQASLNNTPNDLENDEEKEKEEEREEEIKDDTEYETDEEGPQTKKHLPWHKNLSSVLNKDQLFQLLEKTKVFLHAFIPRFSNLEIFILFGGIVILILAILAFLALLF